MYIYATGLGFRAYRERGIYVYRYIYMFQKGYMEICFGFRVQGFWNSNKEIRVYIYKYTHIDSCVYRGI